MKPPLPLSADDGRLWPGLGKFIQSAGTEDPEEVQRRVEEWTKTHGDYSHVILWCGPQIITTTGEPTSVFVVKHQRVVPCEKYGADILVGSDELWRAAVKVDLVPFMSYCLLPLRCATERSEDGPYLVRMKKLGVTRVSERKSAAQ